MRKAIWTLPWFCGFSFYYKINYFEQHDIYNFMFSPVSFVWSLILNVPSGLSSDGKLYFRDLNSYSFFFSCNPSRIYMIWVAVQCVLWIVMKELPRLNNWHMWEVRPISYSTMNRMKLSHCIIEDNWKSLSCSTIPQFLLQNELLETALDNCLSWFQRCYS